MDDDFNFGASIWASNTPPTSESLASSSSKPAFSAFPTETEDAFEDGNFEFSTPLQASTFAGADDGFDDFGDFGDVVEGDAIETFDQESTTSDGDAFAPAGRTTDWNALCLDPLPSSSSLKQGIGDLMEPFWDTREASQFLRDENIRQVGGLNQVLVTPERYRRIRFTNTVFSPDFAVDNYIKSFCSLHYQSCSLLTGLGLEYGDDISSRLVYP